MNWSSIATRYSFAFIPIGFGMWLAHYSFHFFTSFDTVIPATQRFAADHGWNVLGSPLLQCACCRPVAGWIPHLEILMLDFGLLLSLYTGFRIAETDTTHASQTLKAFCALGSVDFAAVHVRNLDFISTDGNARHVARSWPKHAIAPICRKHAINS